MEFDGSKVKLTMPNVQTSDSDSYKCVAENEAGQDQIKANVSVIGEENFAIHSMSLMVLYKKWMFMVLYKKWVFILHSILHYLYWYLCWELSLYLNFVI